MNNNLEPIQRKHNKKNESNKPHVDVEEKIQLGHHTTSSLPNNRLHQTSHAFIFAGFWRRAIALSIDVCVVVASMLFIIVTALLLQMPLLTFLVLPFTWLYFTLMEKSERQGTFGKRAMRIKVVDKSGNKIGFKTANIRYFGKLISGFILYFGFFMAGFTKNKQALHDIMANIYVVRGE